MKTKLLRKFRKDLRIVETTDGKWSAQYYNENGSDWFFIYKNFAGLYTHEFDSMNTAMSLIHKNILEKLKRTTTYIRREKKKIKLKSKYLNNQPNKQVIYF